MVAKCAGDCRAGADHLAAGAERSPGTHQPPGVARIVTTVTGTFVVSVPLPLLHAHHHIVAEKETHFNLLLLDRIITNNHIQLPSDRTN